MLLRRSTEHLLRTSYRTLLRRFSNPKVQLCVENTFLKVAHVVQTYISFFGFRTVSDSFPTMAIRERLIITRHHLLDRL